MVMGPASLSSLRRELVIVIVSFARPIGRSFERFRENVGSASFSFDAWLPQVREWVTDVLPALHLPALQPWARHRGRPTW
jgi:hypothetical protein